MGSFRPLISAFDSQINSGSDKAYLTFEARRYGAVKRLATI